MSDATLPTHFIQGIVTRKEGTDAFWFAVAHSKAEAERLAKEWNAGFEHFLAEKNLPRDCVNNFRIEPTALTPDDAKANGELIVALAGLAPAQIFNNFLTFVGKRDFKSRFKQRKK